MADQPSLPFVRGSETSREAAESMAHIAVSDEVRVQRYIKAQPLGATDDEIEVALEMRHQTASARRRGLVLKGRVKDSGQKRNTRSGRRATVWVVK